MSEQITDLSTLDASELADRLGALRRFFDAPALADQLAAIEDRMTEPGFWDNREAAQKDMERVSSIKAKLGPLAQLELRVGDLEILKEMALEEQEHASKVQASAEVAKEFHALSGEIEKFELRQLLSGEFDKNDAFIIINAGAGGTESCDWADMLMRMYKRWIERSGFTASVVDIQEGDEAGIKSVTLEVKGDYAFGYLQTERGVHRLVRISPFDSAKRRHTSFASVDVNPDIKDVPVELDEEDIRVDTYRSGGKGGQNVNKVETAVRMTHIPSGVVVACQAERSQLKNRVLALKMIKVKLYQIEADRKRAEIDRQYSEKGEIAWGSQIRSYVFQPYQMVKDHRTGVQTGNVQEVMDGDLDAFIEAKLRGVKKGAGADNDEDL
ncbi:MAG: peptide chain release factor 2 [Chthoniobacterales bacterium]